MPKSDKKHALARQWEMLRQIPSRSPGITASKLAERLKEREFQVSKRTVERDLIELSRIFPLRCNDVCAPYGWHWMEGFGVSLPAADIEESLALAFTERLLLQMLPESFLKVFKTRFATARAKLNAIPEHPFSRWSQKVRYVPSSFPTLPPKINTGVFDSVQLALCDGTQLEASYAGVDSSASRPLVLHPLGLVLSGRTPYLVATAFNYADIRLYALHRMRKVQILQEKAQTPADFDIDHYLGTRAMEFGRGKSVRLRACISNKLAIYLQETPLCEQQKIDYRQGRWELAAVLCDTWQLRFWILSQGAEIEIISPKSLRQDIKNTLEDACEAYKRSPGANAT